MSSMRVSGRSSPKAARHCSSSQVGKITSTAMLSSGCQSAAIAAAPRSAASSSLSRVAATMPTATAVAPIVAAPAGVKNRIFNSILAAAEDENLVFVPPEEGLMIWADNMLVPNKASHKANAEEWINYIYDRVNYAKLVAFVQYSERFWRPISDLSEKFNIMQQAMASSERIFALLDTPLTVQAFAKRDTGRQIVGVWSGTAKPSESTARTATPDQWRHLRLRDKGCTWPGCDRPPGWCQAHVRHEAPCNRKRVRDPPLRPVAAGR